MGGGDGEKSKKRRFAEGAVGAGFEGGKLLGKAVGYGCILGTYFGVVRPGRWVWDQTIQPKLDERKRRKEAEEQAERRKSRAEELERQRLEREAEILARRDHQEALRRFKEAMKVRRILETGHEGVGRKYIEQEWKRIRGTEGTEPSDHLTDPAIVSQLAEDGRTLHRCVCCGQFASPAEGCGSCREGWGPPRRSPDQMVRILRERWKEATYPPGLVGLIGDYENGVHGVEEPERILIGMGQRPADIPQDEWIDMPDAERVKLAKAICVWRNGFVGVSKVPYRELKDREDAGGARVWEDPRDYDDSGYRIKQVKPAHGREWAGPQDIWVGQVTTKRSEMGDKRKGSKGITNAKKVLGEIGKEALVSSIALLP